jgi:hypothetical protein
MSVKPWDLFNPQESKVSENVLNKRLDVCYICPQFIKATKQCKKCGCFMSLKAKLENATCPLNKWPELEII